MGPRLATLLSLTLLSGAGYLYWQTRVDPPMSIVGDVPPAGELNISTQGPKSAKPISTSALEERPLFSRSRSPYVEPEPEPEPEILIEEELVEEPPEPEPEVEEPPEPEPVPEPRLDVQLRGIITTTVRKIAVVYDPTTNQELSLHEEDEIRGWILRRIENRKVIFRNDGLTREITMPRAADDEE